MNVLVTGGAGFIGTHLARRLLREGCAVTVLDIFSTQVHAGVKELAPDLANQVRLVSGDVRNQTLVSQLLEDQDVIVHLAAETGTGQSMYEVKRYEDTNIGGTATIIDALVNARNRRVKKFILASSRAVYGEGQFRCSEHGTVYPEQRRLADLLKGQYDLLCPYCDSQCLPEATSEDSPLHPLSFYGLTKKAQEEMLFMFARTCGISASALRYQNVYGPGQSLSNPYTGILAIFCGLARAGEPILVFEDGQETRDFVFIDDVVESTWRFIAERREISGSFNVGSGERTTVLEVAKQIARFFGDNAPVSVTGAFREGDIRHNCANLSKMNAAIGFTPRWDFADGLPRFLEWAKNEETNISEYQSSLHDMAGRGLLHE